MAKIFVTLLLFLTGTLLGQSPSLNYAQSVYESIDSFYKKSFPEQFVADVRSEVLKKSLERIPKSAQNGDPKVQLIFSKKLGARFIVLNVSAQYKNRYASYNAIFILLKPFILGQGYSHFALSYELIPLAPYHFKLKKRINLESDYYELIYDELGKIKKVAIFENKKKVRVIQLVYQNIGAYQIFSKILDLPVKEKKKTIEFNHFKTDPHLRETDFLG